MRLRALGAQGGALGHAEAVLFVRDDHAEAGKARLLREQGVCADDDVREAELRRLAPKVPVDYTRIRFVKKPNGAKPGMVIFTNNYTVLVDPDEQLFARVEA